MSDTLGMSERAVLDCIQESTHWPLECSLSTRALWQAGLAIHEHLRGATPMPERVRNELTNTVNIIRAHLQHIAADARRAAVATDPLLL